MEEGTTSMRNRYNTRYVSRIISLLLQCLIIIGTNCKKDFFIAQMLEALLVLIMEAKTLQVSQTILTSLLTLHSERKVRTILLSLLNPRAH